MTRFTEVHHEGDLAALCDDRGAVLVGAAASWPEDDPRRGHVYAKCLIAGAIRMGLAPGPYSDALADAAAAVLTEEESPRWLPLP